MRPFSALLLAASICGCGERETLEDKRSVTEGVASTGAGAAPTIPAPAIGGDVKSDAPAGPQPARQIPVMALDSEGLRLVDPRNGSTRLLAFGVPEAQALAALAAVRGAPAGRADNPECGSGPHQVLSWPDGFQLRLQDRRFAGWSVQEGATPGAAATMSGLGVGSTRRELKAAYEARPAKSTLGVEFHAGGISGLLSSDAPDGRITTLWAGASCVFR